MKKLIAVLPLILVFTGCNQAALPVDPSVITSRSDAWEAALNAADIDALVALYTSDARLLPPNGEIVSGSAAVRTEFGGMIDAGLGGELMSVEAMVSGDIGYNVGTYTLTDGDNLVDTGKFIEVWHRGDDGVWRIANDIWNSDGAMAAEAHANIHLMILHEVEDGDRWMAAWRGEDSRHKLFTDNGAVYVHTFRSADNPNLTGLIVNVSDMDAFQAMLESDEGQAAAAADGVDMESMTVLTETK
jgi:ketosteroid isomerase-like protein